MNNKGFTLIELIVTIILLAMILSIGAYSIISIVKDSREKNYNTLIKSVKSAVESYAIECKYSHDAGDDDNITCSNQITLGDLVKYGFLSGNSKNETNQNYTIVNPKDNISIANCTISYTNTNGKITISAVNPTGSCPTSY